MSSAIASLEARLAKGGGTPEDWELLAKSYEFVGRPEDAAKAREHRFPAPSSALEPLGPGLPRLGPSSSAPSTQSGSAQSGTAIVGEVSLAETLRGKAKAGETLFIVAKSIDSPGAPVAVFRSSVGEWPVKFRLDDSQSMLPGRNLSSAGRVKIEVRISASGQALPAAGDLKGSSGVLNPADGKPLKIVIDEVVT
jgi:cytochrome c-type biogenesis protein CcmH